MRQLVVRVLSDQRVRFLALGGFNTVLGFSIFGVLDAWVFQDLRFGYLLSLASAYTVVIVVAFALYRRYVFVVTGNVLEDFARFVTVYAAAVTVNTALLPVLVEIVGMPPLPAQAVILTITTLMSFFGHKTFSFQRKDVTG